MALVVQDENGIVQAVHELVVQRLLVGLRADQRGGGGVGGRGRSRGLGGRREHDRGGSGVGTEPEGRGGRLNRGRGRGGGAKRHDVVHLRRRDRDGL